MLGPAALHCSAGMPAKVRAYTYHILFASAARLLAIGGSEKAGSRGIKDEAIG
jgi:hypothetical protein